VVADADLVDVAVADIAAVPLTDSVEDDCTVTLAVTEREAVRVLVVVFFDREAEPDAD
jgi:hypothetical protein